MNKSIITKCPKCGSDKISEYDNFCTMCKTDLRPYKTTLGCCKTTLLIMHDAWNYCPFCGATDPLSLAAV